MYVNQGWSRKKISEFFQEKYGLGHTQAYNIVAQALHQLNETILQAGNIFEMRNAQMERAEALLEMAIKEGDLKTAIKAQDMINRLQCLYVEKSEIKAKTEAKIETWTLEYGE